MVSALRNFPPKDFFSLSLCATLPCMTKTPCAGSTNFLRLRSTFANVGSSVYAFCHGKTFSTAEYERIAEVDRDAAYREIRSMVKTASSPRLNPRAGATASSNGSNESAR